MSVPARKFHRLAAAAVALAVSAALISGSPRVAVADDDPDDERPGSGKLRWTPCGAPFECAVLHAPLEPDDRDRGRKVAIALIRLPSTNPGAKIGSLVVNPGGPGAPGVDFVREIGLFLPPALRGSFDLVGFDPRGVVRSTPLRCFGSPAEWEPFFLPFPFPITEEQEEAWFEADEFLQEACDERGGRIGDHMSTAQAARDMDRIRAAVGDPKLTYLGFSYGSFLGNVYANLFPGRVRAVVLDGVLDPVAWTTGDPGEEHLPFSTRLGSAGGATVGLQQFFAACDAAGTDCALSGRAEARFDDLAEALAEKPAEIRDPETGETLPFSYADLVAVALGALYTEFAWKSLAEFLAFVEESRSPAALGRSLLRLRADLGLDTGGIETDYQNFLEGFPGVACTDSDNPDQPEAWSKAAAAAPGYFGAIWTWASSICSDWPFEDDDRYTGPWDARTAAPVLLVGNLGDPATAYTDAQRVAGLLPSSRLLTYEGGGHTAVGGLSSCIDSAVIDYLLSVRLPAAGTSCPRELDPFAPELGAPVAGSAVARAQVAAQLPSVVREALNR
ncbi:MAG TPA: alpha/beta hydrolase [Actinomycetes bacterium]|nr:alpha/beta hydrolase [Actinomycetes bacterium]